MVHNTGICPMTYGRHLHVEFLARRRNCLSIRRLHWPGKRALHVADNCGPMPIGDLDRMCGDPRVRHRNKHGLEILDVPVDAVGLMPVRPGDGDIGRVALLEAIPLLITEHIKIESVEFQRCSAILLAESFRAATCPADSADRLAFAPLSPREHAAKTTANIAATIPTALPILRFMRTPIGRC